MLSILKDRKNGDISCPEVWRPICLLSKGKLYFVQKYGGRYLIKDWCHLSILFCGVHRHSYLFYYRECSACH